MIVSLGGISLDDNLYLDGILNDSDFAMSVRPTLGGGVVVQIGAHEGGRELALVATQDGDEINGHFTLNQLQQIKVLAKAAQPVPLVHHGATYTVLIGPKPDVTPVMGHVDPAGEDLYIGTISMIGV